MTSETYTTTRPVRILLADYPVLTRHALRCLIEAGGSFHVVAEAANMDEIADHARRSTVDVVAIDFDMPGLDGLDTVPWHGQPDAPATVVIARHQEVGELDRALQIGANGYVTKNDDADVLYLALREAASGRSFLSPRVTRTVLDALARPGDQPSEALTRSAVRHTTAGSETRADPD
ncbi:response regulator [Halofilum ochraceum]|uniref:response regulator n=1 Tax=Halofilum ochraceum TaxID=1611323 RepID=UPI0008DB2603|nr:response regulator transcription factor [Halofilum ochraceum]